MCRVFVNPSMSDVNDCRPLNMPCECTAEASCHVQGVREPLHERCGGYY